MEWSTRPPPASSLQCTGANFFPPANESTQNFPGNNQIIDSNGNSIVTDNLLFQNIGNSTNLRLIVPKTSASTTDFGSAQHLLAVNPGSNISLSSVAVRMPVCKTQNSNLMAKKRIPSSMILQPNASNPVQNVSQAVTLPVGLNSHNNQPLQNSSNCLRTKVHHQSSTNYMIPKAVPTEIPYYHVTSPSTSSNAMVPFNQTSSQFLNSQQGFPQLTFLLDQNNHCQIQSQQLTSSNVTPAQYPVFSHYNTSSAVQSFQQVPNFKPPPPYTKPLLQQNNGCFVVQQQVANVSNENAQNYSTPALDQRSASFSTHHGQKHQPASTTKEISETGNTTNGVNFHRAENQIPLETGKTSANTGGCPLSNGQTFSHNISLPQTILTLEQENNLGSSLGKFPENSSNFKFNIMRENSTIAAVKKLKTLLKDVEFCKIAKRYGIVLAERKKQASDTSIHNQNSSNANKNQPSPLFPNTSQGLQPASFDTTQNPSFSHISYNSKKVKDVPEVPLRVGNHLMPILKDMLKGTVDEDICLGKGDALQNRQLVTKGHSLSADSSSFGEQSENLVNKSQKVMEEGSEELQRNALSCPTLNQQNNCFEGAYLQTPEKNMNVRSENVSELNSSAVVARQTVCPTIAVQKPSGTESSCEAGRVCSWEELKTSLALWRKTPSTTLNLQINTESPVSIPPSDSGAEAKNAQQLLENLSSTLAQTKAPESNETIPSSHEKSLSGVTSNLLKGSEPQVAIVSPLVLSSREIIQNKVNNLSISEIDQAVKEDSICNLQKIISTMEQAVDYTADILKKANFDTQQKVTRSNDENTIVKAEVLANDLNQVVQKDGKSFESGPDLIKPGDCTVAMSNNSELQISSVCTLVQGDEFYNSQIASIFNTSFSNFVVKSEKASEENMILLQHNNQGVGLKNDSGINVSSDTDFLMPSQESLSNIITEKLLEEVPNLEKLQGKVSSEMNARGSKEYRSNYLPEGTPVLQKEAEQDKSSDVCTAVLASINQESVENKEGVVDGAVDGEHAASKENAPVYLPVEQTLENSENGTEGSEVCLIDQLTELSEEFPYGIGDFKVLKEVESRNSAFSSSITEGKETCEETLGPSGVEQIKLAMLNSQQINEAFPEHSKLLPNMLRNSKNDKQNGNTKESMEVARRTSAVQTTDRNTNRTFCCIEGWFASLYSLQPCSCESPQELDSKQKVDLSSQYENLLKVEEKGIDDNKADCRQNLHKDSNDVTLKDQNKILGIPVGEEKSDFEIKNRPSKADPDTIPLLLLEKTDSCEDPKIKEEVQELPLCASSKSLKIKKVAIKQPHGETNGQESLFANQIQCQSSREDLKTKQAVPMRKKVKWKTRIEGNSRKSKPDTCQQRRVEIKHSTYYERYKIKRVSSETHMIKGPIRNKELKKQKTKENKHKAIRVQHSEVIDSSISCSVKVQKLQDNSTLHSQEQLSRKKLESRINLEKNYGYRKTNLPYVNARKQTETSSSEHTGQKTVTKCLKRGISLEKYAYSKEKRNSWKYRSSHLGNDDTSQKYRDHDSSKSKTLCAASETRQNVHNREKYPEKCLSDKVCFNRRPGRLSVSLKKEQKKNYLNRVAFKRTAQKKIYLTSLEPHSKTVWRVKASTVSGFSEDQKQNSSPSQQPEVGRPQMLEFKMCPEILFRNPVSEEQILNAKLPEREETPIKAVKSKREDWINYLPFKKRKTEEAKIQGDEIPFETALKLLDENKPFQVQRKDSKATYESFRKLYLEKRSRSLDGV